MNPLISKKSQEVVRLIATIGQIAIDNDIDLLNTLCDKAAARIAELKTTINTPPKGDEKIGE